MARVFESIRIYEHTSKSYIDSGVTHHIEFVYKPGPFKDFVKKYIISDEGTYKSFTRDGKLANSPMDYCDFVSFLRDLKVDDNTGKFKISTMKRIPTLEVQGDNGKLYEETEFDGDINDVVELAKNLYDNKNWSEEQRTANKAVLTETCKNIIDLKLEEDEPNA
ncbi:MAG: hypothetical protein IJB98_01580 [Clostridia bacterium]|nr:hypothetical protein [Clostridia bacterium]